MKMKLYALLALAVPMQVYAQPTINKAENYSIGTKMTMYECDATGIKPGAAGANQHWMFDNLVITDSTKSTIMAAANTPSGSNFPTATYAISDGASGYTYYSNTATQANLVGVVDPDVTIKYSNPVLYAVRPYTYGTQMKDTFKETLTQSSMNGDGGGTMSINVDGYGMLHLPNGVFMDVIRVKVTIEETDSFSIVIPPAPPQKFKSKITGEKYVWYDNMHYSPLLVIDSTSFVSDFGSPTTDRSVSYLGREEYPTGINYVKTAKHSFSAAFQDNTLRLNGEFNAANKYDVTVMNLAGQRLAQYNIVAQGKIISLEMNNNIPAGMYLISVYDMNSKGIPVIVKAEKQ